MDSINIVNEKEPFSIDVYEHVILLADKSHDAEVNRGNSIDTYSSHIVASDSVLFAIVGLVLSIDKFADKNRDQLLGVLLILIVSILSSLFSRWRFKYKTYPLPLIIYKEIYRDYSDYKDMEKRLKLYCMRLDEISESIKRSNDSKAKFVKVSTFFFLMGLAMLLTVFIFF